MSPLPYTDIDRIAGDESLPMSERAQPIKDLAASEGLQHEWMGMSDEAIVKEWLA